MSLKVLFVVYDNGSYDHVFPMGVGALSAVLKRDGHEFEVWNQDMHHYKDDHLRIYFLNKNVDTILERKADSTPNVSAIQSGL